jgi:hypothetical protein
MTTMHNAALKAWATRRANAAAKAGTTAAVATAKAPRKSRKAETVAPVANADEASNVIPLATVRRGRKAKAAVDVAPVSEADAGRHPGARRRARHQKGQADPSRPQRRPRSSQALDRSGDRPSPQAKGGARSDPASGETNP